MCPVFSVSCLDSEQSQHLNSVNVSSTCSLRGCDSCVSCPGMFYSACFPLYHTPRRLNSLVKACTDEPAPAPLYSIGNACSHRTAHLLHALGLAWGVSCFCRYTEDKVGLRWRTEKDVVSGKVMNNAEWLQIAAKIITEYCRGCENVIISRRACDERTRFCAVFRKRF